MKHGEFLQFFSEVFRVEKKTVTVIARAIREAGYLTSGARGVNAPDMSVTDAANMSLSLLSGEPPSRVVEALECYRNQTLLEPVDYEEDGLLDVINPNHYASAGQVLEALFRAVGQPEADFSEYLLEDIEDFPNLEVRISENDRCFKILVSTLLEKRRELEFFDVEGVMTAVFDQISESNTRKPERLSSSEYFLGMRTIRSIGTGEIIKIGRAFAVNDVPKKGTAGNPENDR